MNDLSLIATTFLGLESELGSQRLFLLGLVTCALFDHTSCLDNLGSVLRCDSLVTTNVALSILEVSSNLVKLLDDGLLLFELSLLCHSDVVTRIISIQIQ